MQRGVANENGNRVWFYVDLNCLTNANYYAISNGSIVGGITGKYNETLDYQGDKMQNIQGYSVSKIESKLKV
jgi:hypothetical protein